MTRTRRLLAAVLATAVGGGVLAAVPAAAHNPRETPKGAPRMDLEVMVTPELEGRITPGGTDPVVSVDGFGNRFVVARKEDTQTLIGVDPRARTATRASAWAWSSFDDGLTWDNLDVLPRGAEQLVPQGVARDVTSTGPLTLLGENRGATVVVHRVLAAGKGRVASTATTVVGTTLPGAVNADLSLATNGRDGVVAVAAPTQTLVTAVSEADVLVTGGTGLPGSCDVAADPRPSSRAFWAACSDGVVHRSADGGETFTRAGRVPAPPGRPAIDVGPDGIPYVLTGTKLAWLRGGRTVLQDLRLPSGEARGSAFAVSNKGRVAATSYHRERAGAPWTVTVALFSPGSTPVWYGFSDHDPADSGDAPAPPSRSTSVDTDPLGRLQMVWVSTFASVSLVDGQGAFVRLRNVFAARSVTS